MNSVLYLATPLLILLTKYDIFLVDTLKTQIEQHRIRRSMKGNLAGMKDMYNYPVLRNIQPCFSSSVSEDNDDDDVEERLRNSMEEQKARYFTWFPFVPGDIFGITFSTLHFMFDFSYKLLELLG